MNLQRVLIFVGLIDDACKAFVDQLGDDRIDGDGAKGRVKSRG